MGGGNKLSESDYLRWAKSKSLVFVGPLPAGVDAKTYWKCLKCGHEWKTSLSTIKQSKTGCWRCGYDRANDGKRVTVDKLNAVLRKLKVKALSDFPGDRLQKLSLQCSKGHQYQASYVSLKVAAQRKAKGLVTFGGCPSCRDKHISKCRKMPKEAYLLLASQKGGKFLGPVPARATTTTNWLCSCGRPRTASYQTFKEASSCNTCVRIEAMKPLKIKRSQYREIGRQNKVTWYADALPNSPKDFTTWICKSKRHIFQTTYVVLQAGLRRVRGGTRNGCPVCRDYVNGKLVSAPQRRLYELVQKWGPANLNLKAGPYWIDVAVQIDDIKIAIEYDCLYWHDERTQARDKTKRLFLRRQGFKTLRIVALVGLPEQDDLDFRLLRLWDGQKQWDEIRI